MIIMAITNNDIATTGTTRDMIVTMAQHNDPKNKDKKMNDTDNNNDNHNHHTTLRIMTMMIMIYRGCNNNNSNGYCDNGNNVTKAQWIQA